LAEAPRAFTIRLLDDAGISGAVKALRHPAYNILEPDFTYKPDIWELTNGFFTWNRGAPIGHLLVQCLQDPSAVQGG
jgi:hypothetical protein